MNAYISVSFGKRSDLNDEISTIKDVLFENGITPLVFVDKYQFDVSQEHEMMHTAMDEIDNCQFLIAETTDKGIGIGIEAGYAKAKDKTVIYLRNALADHSTTLSGISDYQVIYDNTKDLKLKLEKIINCLPF